MKMMMPRRQEATPNERAPARAEMAMADRGIEPNHLFFRSMISEMWIRSFLDSGRFFFVSSISASVMWNSSMVALSQA